MEFLLRFNKLMPELFSKQCKKPIWNMYINLQRILLQIINLTYKIIDGNKFQSEVETFLKVFEKF